MAVETWPGASLVVAEPELLFAILMEAFDGPALMSQTELVIERPGIEVPGEVPLRLTGLTWEGALTDEPAEGTGGSAMRPVYAQPAGLSLAALLLWIEDGDRCPPRVRHACGQFLRGLQRGHLSRMRTRARATPTASRGEWSGRGRGDLLRPTDTEPFANLDDVRFLTLLQADQEGRHVAIPRIRCGDHVQHPGGTGAVD